MAWIGAALKKSCGYALQDILVMVDMATGPEDLEFWS